ncbi:tumor necrosis factor receptor superfamily member 10A-like isoform X2 [Nycticebus coucang]|uniref:tumor necrosis factor receptor superfamily member 10A-like isoform X2 n=1 Tax=Nycticebus coucang TaxID=9470 RepID=UPI00234D58F2|nr:tumor necrosis factor receptor superfamily member 10A-like isoform X2 [Nycticebus coucang]
MGLARAKPAPGRERVLRARSGFWMLNPLLVTFVFGVWLSVPADSASIIQNEVPQHRPAPQRWRSRPVEGLCPPGTHLSEDGTDCLPCRYGVDYTTHWNELFSCILCTACSADKVERSPCNTIRNTECQCKGGTFWAEESPEVCRPCTPRCPAGTVMKTNCTPWSDIECVHKESGNGVLMIWIGVTLIIVAVVAIAIMCCWICIHLGRDWDTKSVRKVCCWRVAQGRGTEDSTDNQILTIRDSQSTLDFEQEEMKIQELAELRDVTPTSPQEEECLLGQAEADGSQRRRLLVPANGADPIDTLKPFFNSFSDTVPCNSWNQLMRQMGLTENDIHLAKISASSPDDVLNEMLVRWINRKGREASVNSLLEALETLGDRLSKQTIEDRLVGSGKFIFLDSGTDSGVPSE